MRNFQDPLVFNPENAQQNDYRCENQRSRDCPLFCRSAPWAEVERNINHGTDDGQDLEDMQIHHHDHRTQSCVSKFYQTKFQIGFVMSPKDTQFFEIVEYLVMFLPQKEFLNLDLIEEYGLQIEDTKSNTKIKPL